MTGTGGGKWIAGKVGPVSARPMHALKGPAATGEASSGETWRDAEQPQVGSSSDPIPGISAARSQGPASARPMHASYPIGGGVPGQMCASPSPTDQPGNGDTDTGSARRESQDRSEPEGNHSDKRPRTHADQDMSCIHPPEVDIMKIGVKTCVSEKAWRMGLRVGAMVSRTDLRPNGSKSVLARAGHWSDRLRHSMTACAALVPLRPMCGAMRLGPVPK